MQLFASILLSRQRSAYARIQYNDTGIFARPRYILIVSQDRRSDDLIPLYPLYTISVAFVLYDDTTGDKHSGPRIASPHFTKEGNSKEELLSFLKEHDLLDLVWNPVETGTELV